MVAIDEGLSKYITFIPVRAGSWTCTVHAVHNYLTEVFIINDIAPGKNGELPDWKSLEGTEFSDKREIRRVVKDLLIKAKGNIAEGYIAITLVVPRKKVMDVRKYICNLED